MTDRILLIGLTALFVVTFTARNVLAHKRTGTPVRERDRFVASSVISSALCFVVAILSTSETAYRYIGTISSI